MQTSPAVAWFFTAYPPMDGIPPLERIESARIWTEALVEDLAPHCKDYALQLELCPKTNRLHVQGCFKLHNKKRMTGVQALHDGLKSKTTHLENCRNWDESRTYCTKEETRILGPWTGSGTAGSVKVTQLTAVVSAIREGASLNKIADNFPEVYVRNWRGIQDLHARLAPADRPVGPEAVRCLWIWGPSGVGKTRAVYDKYGVDSIFVYPGDGWFSGYERHPVALFDDFRGPKDAKLTRSTILRITDIYKIAVPTKGGFTPWIPRVVIFTSNWSLREVYRKQDWQDDAEYERELAPVERRIKCIEYPQNGFVINLPDLS